MPYLFTSESVSEGHPDKVADQISDALIDNFLAFDSQSKVACETLVTTGQVVLAGEVKSEAYLDVQEIARSVIRKIGYTKSEYMFEANSCGIFSAIHEQSSDINQGVDRKKKRKKKDITEIFPPFKKEKKKKPPRLFNDQIKYHINPTGKFVIGGPHGDTGLTGRKIIVDTYGGKGAHGGGAFSGKDPSKVDRSAAYATRHIAKNLVAAGVCAEVLVQVAYAIGVAKPVGLYVNTFGSSKVKLNDGEIASKIE